MAYGRSLEEALALINGTRREEYGPVEESFRDWAEICSMIFGHVVTSKQMALAMVALKLLREVEKPKFDNLVDMAGYIGLAETLEPSFKPRIASHPSEYQTMCEIKK